MKKRLFSVLAFSASLFLSPQIVAKEKDSAFVPFYFSTDTMGSTIGLAGVAKGVGQPQVALFGMGLYSEKDSYVGFLSAFTTLCHQIFCLARKCIKRALTTTHIT